MSEEPSTYYAPAHIVNPAAGTGDMTPAAGLVNPPYHIVTTTQRLASLGLELAELMKHMHDTPMKLEDINALTERMMVVVNEILEIAERRDPSNE